MEIPMAREKVGSLFQTRKDFDRAPRKKCLLAGCEQAPVRCHSVSRNRLELIAEGGHVLALRTSEVFKAGILTVEAASSLESIGIGEATTFNGFCGTHDSELYQRIDTSPFTKSAIGCLYVAHRNFARQVAEHESRIKQIEQFCRAHRPAHELNRVAIERGMNERKANLKFIKQSYQEISKAISDRKKEKFRHLVLETEEQLDFAVSTIFFPTYSVEGLSFGRDTHRSPISFSIIPEANKSLIIFTAKNQKFLRATKFLDSVQLAVTRGHENLTSAFLMLAALEGYPVFSESWWGSIDLQSQRVFAKACGVYEHEHVTSTILSRKNLPLLSSIKVSGYSFH